MIEKPIQDYYIKELEQHNIDYIHIPNRAFSKKYRTPKCLKDWPDLTFCTNQEVYMREFGVRGAHKVRKERQQTRMEVWSFNGNVDILTVYSMEEAQQDLLNIFKYSLTYS